MPWQQIDGKNVWFEKLRGKPKQRESKRCIYCHEDFCINEVRMHEMLCEGTKLHLKVIRDETVKRQEEKECPLCQKPFTQAVPKQKFCSKSCSRKASKLKRMNEMTASERKAFKYGASISTL